MHGTPSWATIRWMTELAPTEPKRPRPEEPTDDPDTNEVVRPREDSLPEFEEEFEPTLDRPGVPKKDPPCPKGRGRDRRLGR